MMEVKYFQLEKNGHLSQQTFAMVRTSEIGKFGIISHIYVFSWQQWEEIVSCCNIVEDLLEISQPY